jgi:hypothetical protein
MWLAVTGKLGGLRKVFSIGKTIYDGIKVLPDAFRPNGPCGLTLATPNGATVTEALEAAVPVVVGVEGSAATAIGATTAGVGALPPDDINLAFDRKADGLGRSPRAQGSEQKIGSSRAMPEYGKGEFWDSLKSAKDDQSLINLRQKSGGGEVRFDGKYYYKFDQAHKTHKVHLHKYQREGKNVRLIQEIDPENGQIINDVKGIPEPWF